MERNVDPGCSGTGRSMRAKRLQWVLNTVHCRCRISYGTGRPPKLGNCLSTAACSFVPSGFASDCTHFLLALASTVPLSQAKAKPTSYNDRTIRSCRFKDTYRKSKSNRREQSIRQTARHDNLEPQRCTTTRRCHTRFSS